MWSGNGIAVQGYMKIISCFNPIVVSLWGSVTPLEGSIRSLDLRLFEWGSCQIYTLPFHLLYTLIPESCLPSQTQAWKDLRLEYVCILRSYLGGRGCTTSKWILQEYLVEQSGPVHRQWHCASVCRCRHFRSLLVHRDFTEGKEWQ